MILRKVINCLWLPTGRIVDRENILTEKELRCLPCHMLADERLYIYRVW